MRNAETMSGPAGRERVKGAGGWAARLRCGAGLLGLAALLGPGMGCATGPFFVCEGKTSCSTLGTGTGTGTGTGGTTTSNTGDFAYVANSSAGPTYLSAYSIAGNALNSLGSISLGFIPVAIAVAPTNSFLYVASSAGYATPGIYLYSIGSTGALTVAKGGQALAIDQVAAMAISPDGNWLYTVNVDGVTMTQYQVNQTNGGLTTAGVVTLAGTTCGLSAALPVSQSCSVTVGPSEQFVAISLGASGDYVYPYSSTGGVSQEGVQDFTSFSATSPVGNFSTALDKNNYAYVAQTESVSVYGIGATEITSEGTVGYVAGSVPRSIVLSNNDSFVYTANQGNGTISGFGISGNGQLNAISGSPYAGPTNGAAIAVDNTGGYLVDVGYDASAGIRLYTIDQTSGALTQVAAAGTGTGTEYPALIAMTH